MGAGMRPVLAVAVGPVVDGVCEAGDYLLLLVIRDDVKGDVLGIRTGIPGAWRVPCGRGGGGLCCAGRGRAALS
eukprot:11798018-Heterocapsa_arctica.AAC.1